MRPTPSKAAFSLIEIMVVVALLSVIIIGLVAMFSQTQKVLLASTTQVEVLEVGRATADLMGRELEQITPSYTNAPTFFTLLEQTPPFSAFRQSLVGTNELRTNVMERLFFVTHYNQQWDAIGYRLVLAGPGVGTLYRTNYSNISLNDISNKFVSFNNLPLSTVTNMSRIAEGVVHLRVRAYDTNGFVITTNNPAFTIQSIYEPATGDFDYRFFSNAVPASLGLELGFLETRTFDRYKAFNPGGGPAGAAAAANYLSNHVGQVHVFRQRIPVRNVDPTAYQ